MINEFWLALHQLAESYRIEGLTVDERSQRVLKQLERMPAVARREVLSDLALLAYNLTDLYVAAVARARELDEAATAQSKGA